MINAIKKMLKKVFFSRVQAKDGLIKDNGFALYRTIETLETLNITWNTLWLTFSTPSVFPPQHNARKQGLFPRMQKPA